MTTRLLAITVAACLMLAAATLLAPHAPAYDAWAWLVWGRELATFSLDTSSGPSFKPLPVVIAALLSPAGEAAPALWLLIVRASFFLSLVLAGALAYRLTVGVDRRLRWLASGFASLCLLLLFDEITAWPRQAAIGMSEPLLVALVLGAITAALAGSVRGALALAGLAALVRPEVWPLLAAYGLWCWRTDRTLRPWLVALALAVPALWFVPDALTSGGASGAAERARRGDGTPLEALLEVLGRAATMPLAAVWPLAAFAVLGVSGGKRPHAGRFPPVDSRARILAAGALAWIAIVALMAAFGFPGLPRFMAPALAVVGVLAGAGLAQLTAHAHRPAALAAVLAVLAVTIVQLPGRIVVARDGLAFSERAAHRQHDARVLVRRIGREPLLRCGKLASSSLLVRTALAWELGVPLSEIVTFGGPPSRSGAFLAGPGTSIPARVRLGIRGVLLGERGEWRAYSLRCSPSTVASSSRSAGVSGARR